MDKIDKKHIDYDQIVEETLRLVVKKSLELVNEEGLPGNHHFYISFDSTHDGVKVPSELKAGEDNEIKIILQHQFWDLIIDDHKFSVVLSFSGKKKNISVPFNSITSFSDPSVGFSLQFKKDFLAENISKEKKYHQINPMKIRSKSLMLKYSLWMHLDLKKKIKIKRNLL